MTAAGGELTEYGFTFGAAEVTRLASIDGAVCLRVDTTAGLRIEIYVSPAGRSLRVFRDGDELGGAK